MDKKQLSLLSWVCLHLASAHFDTLSNRLSFVGMVIGPHAQRDLCSVMRDSYSSNEIHHYIVRVVCLEVSALMPESVRHRVPTTGEGSPIFVVCVCGSDPNSDLRT